MLNTLITNLQIFGIGFSFGVAGPCFLVCTPILITYIVGSDKTLRDVLRDGLSFFIGRLISYVMLGILAGWSGLILRRFFGSHFAIFLGPLGGAVSILLAIIILVRREDVPSACQSARVIKTARKSLFVLGFIIGISPCPPLLALLFEIALISKNAFEGICYAFSFGLGTLVSGLIVVGVLAGVVTGFTSKLLRSKTSSIVIKIICALLLMLLGLWLMLGKYSYNGYRI